MFIFASRCVVDVCRLFFSKRFPHFTLHKTTPRLAHTSLSELFYLFRDKQLSFTAAAGGLILVLPSPRVDMLSSSFCFFLAALNYILASIQLFSYYSNFLVIRRKPAAFFPRFLAESHTSTQLLQPFRKFDRPSRFHFCCCYCCHYWNGNNPLFALGMHCLHRCPWSSSSCPAASRRPGQW